MNQLANTTRLINDIKHKTKQEKIIYYYDQIKSNEINERKKKQKNNEK